MQIGQLRKVVEAFADFGVEVCGSGSAADLKRVAAVFPAGSQATTASFIAQVKKSLPKGGQLECPIALRNQLERMEAALSVAGSKAAGDVKSLLALLHPGRSVDTAGFVQQLIAARDFVPTLKPPKVSKPAGSSRVDAVVTGYVDRFKSSVVRSDDFEAVFSALRADAKLSDARIKKISKALWGKAAKSREEAFDHIRAFQKREALSYSSTKALELTRV